MGYRRTRILLAAGAGALVLTAVGPMTAHVAGAGPNGSACTLQGTAHINPGLNSTSKPFTYGFDGALGNCVSQAGPAGGGNVTAGEVITIGGVNYQEPLATGTGACSSSTTAGEAIVKYADGGVTVEKYTTTGAAALVVLQGSVEPSIKLNAVPGQTGSPGPITVTTTRNAGASTLAVLVFEATPTDCTSAAGVTNAGIAGVVGVGSPT